MNNSNTNETNNVNTNNTNTNVNVNPNPDVNTNVNMNVNPNVTNTNTNQTVNTASINGQFEQTNNTVPSQIQPDLTNNVGNQNNSSQSVEVLEDNQNMKEVEINYTPPSKFKVFLLVSFFVLLIAFVIFLPEINSFMETYKAKKQSATSQIITTGRLICTLKKSTENLDLSYENIFHFTDSKLNSLNYTVTTKGDATLDEATLDAEQDKCLLLKRDTEEIQGVNVSCDYKQGQQTIIQNFTFGDIDTETMDAAYAEAGGELVEFENEENIDIIEKNMKASGYTCERRTN